MHRRLYIFDLDGTLLNTAPGILDSYRAGLEAVGFPAAKEAVRRAVIGGPLLQNFMEQFSLDETDVKRAVKAYRLYYEKTGIHQAEVYPGTKRLLSAMRRDGAFCAVATLKRADFARSILQEFGLFSYFDCIEGMDRSDTLTKSALILRCMHACGVSCTETLMIGDSIFDAEGAREAGVPFAGVLHGFGFSAEQEVYACGGIMAAADFCVLSRILCSL